MKSYVVQKLDHYGRGIVKEDNHIIFVENALPDEIVNIKVTKSKKKIAEAQVLSYKKRSGYRVSPSCPYYSVCGGCHIMHLSYEKQLEWKYEKVKEILKKFMDFKSDFVIQPIVGTDAIAYRNKVTFQVDRQIGYFQKESHEIVPISDCKLIDSQMNLILSKLRKLKIDNCMQIVIRASKNLKQSMIIFITNGNVNEQMIIDELGSIVTSIYIKNNELKCIYGNLYIEEHLHDFSFEISPLSFFQVNTHQAEKLYDIVKKYANLSKKDKLLDLYCGTGTIGIYLSKDCEYVLGIEVNEQAIFDARRNQVKNGCHNIEFVCGDVSSVVSNIRKHFDVVIVDPPRSGLDHQTISFLRKGNFKRVIYVSCDPVTLARDLNFLSEVYSIEELTPVDMFPNTYHVECVCLLNRR